MFKKPDSGSLEERTSERGDHQDKKVRSGPSLREKKRESGLSFVVVIVENVEIFHTN